MKKMVLVAYLSVAALVLGIPLALLHGASWWLSDKTTVWLDAMAHHSERLMAYVNDKSET